MLAPEHVDPEYTRALRDLRSDVIVEVAAAMPAGATREQLRAAIRERLDRGLPRLVAQPYETTRNHARNLWRDPTNTLVVNGRPRRASPKRDAANRAGRCVNENKARTHGPATHGCRCEACWRQHRRSA